MPVNRKALGEAERRLRHQSTRAAAELRSLRLRAGLSQAAVAREAGITRSVVTRLEAGDPGITLRTRFRIATVLGADLRVTAFAESGPLIRDAAQATIIEELLTGIDRRWGQTPEASVPGPGRRSVDLRLDGPDAIVLIEVESHLGSLEEIIRELHSKRQALAEAEPDRMRRLIHVVLCLPRTRHHLSILRAHPRIIAAAFPQSSAHIEAALADCSRPWPGDGLLLVAAPRLVPIPGPPARARTIRS
jgi:transcriptional regulator with XRE-family HTH domain